MILLTAPTGTQILNSMEDVFKQLQGLGELLKQTPPCKQLLAEKSQVFFCGKYGKCFHSGCSIGRYTIIGSTIRFPFTKMKHGSCIRTYHPPVNHHNRACGCIKFPAQYIF